MADHDLCLLAPLRIEASAVRRGAVTATVRRTGMGPARSRRAARMIVAELDETHPVAIVGFCGGLAPDLRPGDVIVASELWSADGEVSMRLPGAEMLVAELAELGLPARCGPLVSTDRVVRGRARRVLADRGALAVDMESAWLAEGVRRPAQTRPVAVVRVVVDSPGHELVSTRTPRNVQLARRRLSAVVPVLERWARATGPRRLVMAGPRSFCAGVERAIEIVERALDRFEPPVYVRRQIVHNTHVVSDLESRGAVFVQEVDEVPPGSLLVLAAHGVAPEVRRQAEKRRLRVIDATCPLVAKVHSEARRFAARGYDIVLIGHDDHEEVEGTIGEAPAEISVVTSRSDVDELEVADPDRVAFLTQTTLAVDEVDEIVTSLRDRYPGLVGPRSDDICYATQNRQSAIAVLAPETDLVLVVGSPNSSNSKRLTEVASRNGNHSYLIDGCSDLSLDWLEGAKTIGISAGASAPESKVQEVVAAIGALGTVTVEERRVHDEAVSFSLPPEVR